MKDKLSKEFFVRDVLEVAPELLGQYLVRNYETGGSYRYLITEVEAYRGEEDKACHASKGRTKRTEIMYHEGGGIYVYLVYGMYWMLNFVTGEKDNPQAILIRGVKDFHGPGVLTRELKISNSFYGEDLNCSQRIWVEKSQGNHGFSVAPRIGINYAGDEWKNKPWRFILK
ncbi:MAG: DNA-3-methyladenine glycosylase [Bacteroidetes bacterium]|nr:DNA-3-methyladenine glycosylase [Bacteroidota bacterium]